MDAGAADADGPASNDSDLVRQAIHPIFLSDGVRVADGNAVSDLSLSRSGIRLQPLQQPILVRREHRRRPMPPVLRYRPFARFQPALDRVPRSTRARHDLADRQPVAKPQTSYLAQHVHGDHLLLPCLKNGQAG